MGNLLLRFQLVHLLNVHRQTTCCVKLSWTVPTLVVFGFLMLHEDL